MTLRRMNRRSGGVAMAAASLWLAGATPAFAQEAPAPQGPQADQPAPAATRVAARSAGFGQRLRNRYPVQGYADGAARRTARRGQWRQVLCRWRAGQDAVRRHLEGRFQGRAAADRGRPDLDAALHRIAQRQCLRGVAARPGKCCRPDRGLYQLPARAARQGERFRARRPDVAGNLAGTSRPAARGAWSTRSPRPRSTPGSARRPRCSASRRPCMPASASTSWR